MLKDLRTIQSILSNYEQPFIAALNEQCNAYKLIGSGTSESPAWFIYSGVHDNKIKFVNSQRMAIFFQISLIDLDDKEIFQFADLNIISDYFRELKYSFIHSQHPAIETQNRPKKAVKETKQITAETIAPKKYEPVNYQQNAIDFLNKTGVKMTVKFIKNGKHFDTDKEDRDIYEIEFIRGNRSMQIMFGQSLNNSGFKLKTVVNERKIATPDSERNLLLTNNKAIRFLVEKIVKFNLITTDKIIKPTEPNAYDVLACLQKHDIGTYENFCDEFGYNTDSKSAEKTYKAVKDEYLKVCSLFTEQEIEILSEINQ